MTALLTHLMEIHAKNHKSGQVKPLSHDRSAEKFPLNLLRSRHHYRLVYADPLLHHENPPRRQSHASSPDVTVVEVAQFPKK